MRKDENNLRAEINDRIFQQIGGEKGIPVTFNKLKDGEGWKTPQPLYNVKNGKANLTTTTLYDIGSVDENFSADIAIFGEYRYPKSMKEMEMTIKAKDLEIQKTNEELRTNKIRAERAESLNEVLQNALKEAMKNNGVNFHEVYASSLLDNIDPILCLDLLTRTNMVGHAFTKDLAGNC